MSRHPSKQSTATSRQQNVAEEYINYLATMSTPKALTLSNIEAATIADVTLQAVSEAMEKGNWHEAHKRPGVDRIACGLLAKVKDEVTVCLSTKVILRGTWIVVPKVMHEHVLKLAHEGHQRLVKTKALLREKVWFQGMDRMVEELVKFCDACLICSSESKREPLKMSPLPDGP